MRDCGHVSISRSGPISAEKSADMYPAFVLSKSTHVFPFSFRTEVAREEPLQFFERRFHGGLRESAAEIPLPACEAIQLLSCLIANLSEEIKCYDQRIDLMAREESQQREAHHRVFSATGIGLLTSLAYVQFVELSVHFSSSDISSKQAHGVVQGASLTRKRSMLRSGPFSSEIERTSRSRLFYQVSIWALKIRIPLQKRRVPPSRNHCLLDLSGVFRPTFFFGGRPVFGWGTNASTSELRTTVRPAARTAVNLPRRIRSAIACLDTPRILAASACEM